MAAVIISYMLQLHVIFVLSANCNNYVIRSARIQDPKLDTSYMNMKRRQTMR